MKRLAAGLSVVALGVVLAVAVIGAPLAQRPQTALALEDPVEGGVFESTMTISASPVTPEQIQVGGYLRGYGLGLERCTVVVECSSDAITWSELATVTTGLHGWYSVTTTVDRLTYYRASYAGGDASHYVGWVYGPTASPVVSRMPSPVLRWLTDPPSSIGLGKSFIIKTSAETTAHGPCSATVHCERLQAGVWVSRKTFTVSGSYDATSSRMSFAARTSLPYAGRWRIWFDLAPDAAHLGSSSLGERFVDVAPTTLTITSPSTVKPKGSARFVGHLRSTLSGRGISGRRVYLEVRDDVSKPWKRIGSDVTSSDGGVSIVANSITHKRLYRFVYPGSTTWHDVASRTRIVETLLTLTGTSPGDYTTKEIWLAPGIHGAIVTLKGSGRSVVAHRRRHSPPKYVLSTTAGTRMCPIELPFNGDWFHFRVYGKGYFKIQIRS